MKRLLSLIVVLGVMSGSAFGALITAPGDVIIAVDRDGPVSNSSYPGAEAPPNVLDNNVYSKYLNFGGAHSGFIVTPSGAASVRSFTLTTANDAPGRDPASWLLFGTNDAVTSMDNSVGRAENWTLIDSGSVSLPDTRLTTGAAVSVSNNTAYSSYRMLYPTLKGDPLMQIADVGFYESTDGSGLNVVGVGDPILAIQEAPASSYPGHEGPANAVDGTLGKYLNFGQTNSGFIVTPAFGESIVDGFEITTANDGIERDPASWELYGTNDGIISEDNGQGNMENWVLIDSGSLALPDERDTLADLVSVSGSTAYTSYKMLFPTVKDSDLANSMQIGEIQFHGVPEPATVCLLGLGGLSLLRRRKR